MLRTSSVKRCAARPASHAPPSLRHCPASPRAWRPVSSTHREASATTWCTIHVNHVHNLFLGLPGQGRVAPVDWDSVAISAEAKALLQGHGVKASTASKLHKALGLEDVGDVKHLTLDLLDGLRLKPLELAPLVRMLEAEQRPEPEGTGQDSSFMALGKPEEPGKQEEERRQRQEEERKVSSAVSSDLEERESYWEEAERRLAEGLEALAEEEENEQEGKEQKEEKEQEEGKEKEEKERIGLRFGWDVEAGAYEGFFVERTTEVRRLLAAEFGAVAQEEKGNEEEEAQSAGLRHGWDEEEGAVEGFLSERRAEVRRLLAAEFGAGGAEEEGQRQGEEAKEAEEEHVRSRLGQEGRDGEERELGWEGWREVAERLLRGHFGALEEEEGRQQTKDEEEKQTRFGHEEEGEFGLEGWREEEERLLAGRFGALEEEERRQQAEEEGLRFASDGAFDEYILARREEMLQLLAAVELAG